MKSTPYTNSSTLAIMFFALLALSLLSPSAHALSTSSPDLNVSLLYYEPVPAAPGSLLDVFLQVTNSGGTANKVRVSFVDNGPFSLDSADDRMKNTETIPSQESFLVKYKVRVSQDAIPGTNYIKVQYSIDGQNDLRTILLPIDVFSSTVSLTIGSVELTPETLTPGGVGKLRLTLRNDAGVKITSGTLTLDLSTSDLVPIGTTNQQRFTELQQGASQMFSFDLSTSPAMLPGVYKIPVLLDFTDQQGKTHQMSEFVGVRVGAKPDTSIIIDNVKVTAEQKTGDVIIRVTNKGIGEVKFVNVVIGKSDSFDLLSSSADRYVGNIDSDDYKTASISVTAKKDIVTIPVTVTYLDALNTQYNKTEMLTFPVRSTSTSGGSSMYWLILVVVIVVIGYFVFRKKKK